MIYDCVLEELEYFFANCRRGEERTKLPAHAVSCSTDKQRKEARWVEGLDDYRIFID